MRRRIALLPDPAGLFGLIAFLVFAGSSGAKALQDGDTLWHIRFGELMLDHGELITRDTFSFTAYGKPWIAHEWLSEIIMALCYRFAGLPGVVLMYFAVAAMAFTVLFQVARRLTSDGAALAAMAIAVPFVMTHLLARPHLFTWLGSALTLLLLVRGGRGRWWLVPLTMIWANLHGGVLFGLAIQALFLGGDLIDAWPGRMPEKWRSWLTGNRQNLIVLAASTFAAAWNPFGLQIFIYPFIVSSKLFSAEISEWQATNLRTIWYFRYWLVAVFLTAACRGRLFAWHWRLLAIFMVWQSLIHVRHVSLAVMLLTPCTALLLQDLARTVHWRRPSPAKATPQLTLSSWTGPVMIVVCCFALMAVFVRVPAAPRSSSNKLFPFPDSYSQELIDHLERHGLPGSRLFNQDTWGDYLIFAMEKPPPLFIDGRVDMYGEEIFADYVAMERLKPEIDQLMIRYGIDWVIFPSDHRFTRALRLDRRWRTVYADEQAVILAKAPETPP